MRQPDDPPDTTASLEAWIIATRLLQGLPPHVEDIEVLCRVIDILGLSQPPSDEPE